MREIVATTGASNGARRSSRPTSRFLAERAVQDGVVPETPLCLRKEVKLARRLGQARSRRNGDWRGVGNRLPSGPAIYDGRFANNGWLQELPRPITQLTWDNAVLISPRHGRAMLGLATCRQHGGEHGQARGRAGGVDLPRPHGGDAGLDHAGPCRRRRHGPSRLWPDDAGRVGNGRRLQRLSGSHRGRPLVRPGPDSSSKTDKDYTLACTQMHHRMQAASRSGRRHSSDYPRATRGFAEVRDRVAGDGSRELTPARAEPAPKRATAGCQAARPCIRVGLQPKHIAGAWRSI